MGCASDFRDLMSRLNAVVKDKWPDALDGNAFIWAEANYPEGYRKLVALQKEANELWKNGQEAEFKKISTEWGKKGLEIHKMYAMDLRLKEAA